MSETENQPIMGGGIEVNIPPPCVSADHELTTLRARVKELEGVLREILQVTQSRSPALACFDIDDIAKAALSKQRKKPK